MDKGVDGRRISSMVMMTGRKAGGKA